MSGIAIIRYLLANNAPMTALVPASRIMSGVLPLNIALPAISVMESVMDERLNVPMNNVLVLQTELVQVAIKSRTYPEQEAILAAVNNACVTVRGLVNGFNVDSILPDLTGPDQYMPEEDIHLQEKGFLVRFIETVG